MKILHYTLGFPPMRSGGLTRYAIDLMSAQSKLGHKVSAIYPGNPSLLKKNNIVKDDNYNGIECFKIDNAPLVPLMHGIRNPKYFLTSDQEDSQKFKDFFKSNGFDVLHVHTMMGLPKSFLLAAKECGVKTVCTSHDYFGLCPKVNFVDHQDNVCDCADSERCAECNTNAKTVWYVWLRNSKLLILAKKLLKL